MSPFNCSQVIAANGQFFDFNKWKPHKKWPRSKGVKKTYDPVRLRLEAEANS